MDVSLNLLKASLNSNQHFWIYFITTDSSLSPGRAHEAEYHFSLTRFPLLKLRVFYPCCLEVKHIKQTVLVLPPRPPPQEPSARALQPGRREAADNERLLASNGQTAIRHLLTPLCSSRLHWSSPPPWDNAITNINKELRGESLCGDSDKWCCRK